MAHVYNKQGIFVQNHPIDPYPVANIRNPWKPGWTSRFPWLGFLGLLGTLLAVAAAAVVLVYSDGRPVHAWYLQPTVYLAIAVAIANALLWFSFTEGLNIIWWRRALDPSSETTVADLHRSWEFGNSLWAAITSGRKFNLIVLASLLVALSPINGPFLQRASTVGIGSFRSSKTLDIYISPKIPTGYTGYVSGRAQECSLLTTKFSRVVEKFTSGTTTNITETDCQGSCHARVKGAGFAVKCYDAEEKYHIEPTNLPNGNINTNSFAPTYVFSTAFNWSVGLGAVYSGQISLLIQYKDDFACNGMLKVRNCTLEHAVVDYPVVIKNRTSIELAPGTSMFNDRVLSVHPNEILDNPGMWTGPVTLGGLARALSNTYSSEATIRFVGSWGYEISSTGATAMRYAQLDENSDSGWLPAQDCTVRFGDPTEELLAAARDLMFRTAIDSAQWSDVQHVPVIDETTVPIFTTHYLFMGLALLFTLLGLIFSMILFKGYWKIGRNVTMSPIETAKAFAPAQLDSSDSNGDVDSLLKEIGSRPIQYGRVKALRGGWLLDETRVQQGDCGRDRLEMQDPKFVTTPIAGELY